ncbi:prepilin-type N-terminal cleavage/methylation domain-containing protein [Candidatus Saccharibacteria bacterium]|nr:prepilin-type N-terminal cleavage/methylation domain-containing protein [Candidatus Saccharibacteria bacterium]
MINKPLSSRGFTIVELLIVIVVIGILAAISIVAYNGIQGRAQAAAVSSSLTQAASKLALYFVDNNTYPATVAAVGIQNSASANYQYTFDNSATPSYCLIATNGSALYSVTNGNISPQNGYCNSSNLVGWWPLNGNPNDNSGYGNNGTVNGAALTTGQSGLANGGYNFNGATNLTVASVFGLGTNNSTVSCWIYNPTNPNKGAFVKIGSAAGGDGFAVGIGNGSFDTVGSYLIMLYETRRWIQTSATIPTGWHHIVMTINNSGQPTAYLDGVYIGLYNGTSPITPVNQTNIGGYGANRMFTGSIDDVRIYNSALTSSDIQAIYNAGGQ